MNLLWFLVVGLVAGWLAGVLVKGGGFGVIGDLVEPDEAGLHWPAAQSRQPRSAATSRITVPMLISAAPRLQGAEEAPFAGHTFECVSTTIDELNARTGNQVPDGARDQHFVGPGSGCYSRSDMHGDPADIVSDEFALAGVQPATDLKAQGAELLTHGTGASYRPSGTIEGGEHAVACPIHLATAERAQLFSYHRVESCQQLAPPLVSHLGRELG